MKLTGAVLLSVVLGICACTSLPPETTFESISVGEGSLEVRYEEILGPAAFAPHTVRFYFRDQDGERFLAQTRLDNDGKNPGEGNVAVTELADRTWQVTLKGEQQADERWLVELGTGDVRMWKPDLATEGDGARP